MSLPMIDALIVASLVVTASCSAAIAIEILTDDNEGQDRMVPVEMVTCVLATPDGEEPNCFVRGEP